MSLSIPPENVRSPKVFWRFQGLQKGILAWNGLKMKNKNEFTFQRFQRINHKIDWISLQLNQRQTTINLDNNENKNRLHNELVSKNLFKKKPWPRSKYTFKVNKNSGLRCWMLILNEFKLSKHLPAQSYQ